jgi:hypothetical protein
MVEKNRNETALRRRLNTPFLQAFLEVAFAGQMDASNE